MGSVQTPGALQLQGERTSGQDIRTQNVMAVAAVANIVKSSLGPVGLDKVCLETYNHLLHAASLRSGAFHMV
jgi:T-complex protein 1 subunit alpha